MMRGWRRSMPRTIASPAAVGARRLCSGRGSASIILFASGSLSRRLVDHLGVDEAEVGDARAGAVLRELHAQRAPELLDRGLAHRVGNLADAVDERVHRGDHDDVPATAHDLRQRRVDRPVDAHQVDVEHALEGLAGHRAERRHARGDARVGDDHVEPAEALHRRRRPRAASRRDRSRPRRARTRGCRAPAPPRLAAASASRSTITTAGPARDQRARGREADPPRPAGDERDLAAELVARHAATVRVPRGERVRS